ncbi:prenyltransferase/squalene oxidase repeat-containing protein [Kitasatospora sp. McL0602]|uniref:prenyltransferase/squalene oxidase repeat-containing protein n=1 Tax=Kitasatospora sp. McL0602 TaxID=3439530 RepID=UPI003F8AAF20
MLTTLLLPAPRATREGTAALRCRDRLARRVAERVGPDGLLDAPCESRVLESALLLHLLTVEEGPAAARDGLVRYLKTTLDVSPPDAIQTAAARAALGEAVPGDRYAVAALASFDHFTAARKRVMFETLLAELGAADFRPVPPEAFRVDGQQSWLRLEMAALKVMSAHGNGHPEAVRAEDWAALEPALGPGRVWEANHLARLIGLIALRRCPGYRPAVRRALARVTADLRPDGGLPFITGMDVFATAIGGLALAGTTRPARLLAEMAEALAAQQHPDGGFGFTRGVAQSDVDDTSYAVEFLRHGVHPGSGRVVAAAENYLLAQRNPDGGFPTFARGTQSEIAMTAAAVNALAPNPAHREVVGRAVRFIAGHQQPQGASALLERSWSRNVSNAVFRTVLACDAAPAGMDGLKQHLLAQLVLGQGGDGGWGHQPGDPSDPISTAYAVIALSRSPRYAERMNRALGYLMNCQQPDGGYRSRPDQAGPRPLLYDAPALADVCVLLAFAHAIGPRD